VSIHLVTKSISTNSVLQQGQKFPDIPITQHGKHLDSSIFLNQRSLIIITNPGCLKCKRIMDRILLESMQLEQNGIRLAFLSNSSKSYFQYYSDIKCKGVQIFRVTDSVLKNDLKIKSLPHAILLDEYLSVIHSFPSGELFDLDIEQIVDLFKHSLEKRRRLICKRIGAVFINKVDVVFQDKPNNCGAACLKMILDHFALKSSLSALSSSLNGGSKSSMADLVRVSRKMGLELEGWNVIGSDLSVLTLPAIALLKRGHYVVLDGIYADTIHIKDPSLGKLRISKTNFKKIWNGKVLMTGKNTKKGGKDV